MKLRSLKQEDETIVKDWLRDYLKTHIAWWSEAYGNPPQLGLDQVVQKNWQRLLEAPSKDYFVTIAETDRLAGIVHALVREDDYLGYDLGVLAWIYVAPQARGHGISSNLMDAASTWMKSQQVKGREVFVTAQNPAAVGLYKRHGYKLIDYRMLAKG